MALYNNALYPSYGVAKLRTQKGVRWAKLVERLRHLPSVDPQVMAFTLLMRRLQKRQGGDVLPHHASLCAVCALEVLSSFEGTEQELLDLYHRTLEELTHRLQTRRVRRLSRVAAKTA